MITSIKDIEKILPVGMNTRDARILQFMEQSEKTWLLPAIGAAKYEALDTGTETDAVLTDGGYYDREWCAGTVRKWCGGIKKAVAYYTYALLLLNGNVNITAFGIVSRNGSYSQATDAALVDKQAASMRNTAEGILQECADYLSGGCKADGKIIKKVSVI